MAGQYSDNGAVPPPHNVSRSRAEMQESPKKGRASVTLAHNVSWSRAELQEMPQQGRASAPPLGWAISFALGIFAGVAMTLMLVSDMHVSGLPSFLPAGNARQTSEEGAGAETTATRASSADSSRTIANAPRKPIWFWHLHKSMGTTICSMMQARHEPVPKEFNCNGDSSVQATLRTQDAERIQRMMQQKNLSIVFSESWAPGRLLDQETSPFSFITVIRQPLARTYSHFVHASSHYCKDLDQPEQFSYCNFAQWALKHQPDNHIVRELLPEKADAPAGSLTMEDLELAKRRLDKFDMVVPMEQIQSDVSARMLEEHLGWKSIEWKHANVRNGASKNSMASTLSKTLYAEIQAHHALDLAVYEHALTLFAQRSKSHRANMEQSALGYASEITSTKNHGKWASCSLKCCEQACDKVL
eukprot:gb/GFBE01066558.1/.p1 GENE.gb/GFBE01066558.1/~~gb/GFBE01066558.1/.p1  ORF type:complete len:416 (+),score=55.27 gb/GFBE01066558.1/:1-1248(+)